MSSPITSAMLCIPAEPLRNCCDCDILAEGRGGPVRCSAHRELRNDSSQILAEVKGGAIIEITNHGDVVAVLVPPTATPYERLVAAGKVQLAKPDRVGNFSDIAPSHSARDPLDVLSELRGE